MFAFCFFFFVVVLFCLTKDIRLGEGHVGDTQGSWMEKRVARATHTPVYTCASLCMLGPGSDTIRRCGLSGVGV